MDHGEMSSGARDEHYDLVSVLYHALHGADNCERYAHDAQAAGDKDLVVFFREAQGMQAQLAERAKGLLGIAPPEPKEAVRPDPPSPPESEERPPREQPPPGEERPERRGETREAYAVAYGATKNLPVRFACALKKDPRPTHDAHARGKIAALRRSTVVGRLT